MVNVLGQLVVPHFCSSLDIPEQGLPPYLGSIQGLVLNIVPPPQVTEHAVQLDHTFHTPSTVKVNTA